MSCAQHQATLFLGRPRRRSTTKAVPRAVALLATVAKVATRSTWSSGTAPTLSRSTTSSRRPSAEKYLNAVLDAKEARAGTVAKGCADESVQERVGLYYEVTAAFIILTESELRSALDRQRDLPKYFTREIPSLEGAPGDRSCTARVRFPSEAPRPTAWRARYSHVPAVRAGPAGSGLQRPGRRCAEHCAWLDSAGC